MSQEEVIGFDLNNKKIKIITTSWKFMQMGEGHIILQNSNQKDPLFHKVLSICRHQINSIPCQLENIYNRLLCNVQEIKQFLIERHEIVFQKSQSDKFIAMMKTIIDLPISKCKVFLADNLARNTNGWDYFLEFKPKTILPDIYSQEFIHEYSGKHRLNSFELTSLLTSSTPIEKTRWFKKNSLKEVKKNLNPFEIFSFKTSNVPNYLKKIKEMKSSTNEKTPSCTPSLQKLSNQMIAQAIRKTEVLQFILKMQLLFTEAHDFRHLNVYNLWKHQLNKESICEFIEAKILAELTSIQSVQSKLQQLYQQAPNFQSAQQFQRSQIEKIIRFLVSWTWKDVSLIIRLKMNSEGSEISECDLKIIDYELKEAAKLAETIKKDEKFLNQYLSYKKIL